MTSKNAVLIDSALQRYFIPLHMRESIKNYLLAGAPVGDFLTALLRDEPIFTVMAIADEPNSHAIMDWCKFVYTFVPAAARRDGMKDWMESNGLEGQKLELIP